MSFHRGIEGSEPVRADPVARRAEQEEHRVARSARLGTGTLACPRCDAPVVPSGAMRPADALGCPYCGATGAVREFLSLAAPARPARVEVRVVRRVRRTVP